jgi:mono/diheme cytochrome c family protein
MARIISVICIVSIIGLIAYGLITLYDESLQVGRMWETPAVKPHEAPLEVMDQGTVPFEHAEALLQNTDPDRMHPPVALSQPDVIAQGQKTYQFYCIHCHGKDHDGNGTVGQSFAPLPGDLRSARVQTLAPGRLFHEISYGIPGGRQPALAATMAVDERWQVIGYIQSLGTRP